jgi:hypothetical protein
MLVSAYPGYPHVRWSRDAADTRIPKVRRLSAAHHGLYSRPRSTCLFAMCGHPLKLQRCLHVRMSSWPSLVTRHTPQPSEQRLICCAVNCSQYRDCTLNYMVIFISLFISSMGWVFQYRTDELIRPEFGLLEFSLKFGISIYLFMNWHNSEKNDPRKEHFFIYSADYHDNLIIFLIIKPLTRLKMF